ncbi:MAG: hypothetical protein MI867_12485 [Pseudomonadales bacterium]|nr:hypothetical protein [Pseudomonadales bacterium]
MITEKELKRFEIGDLRKALDIVSRLCQEGGHLNMSIPPRRIDEDMVLGRVIAKCAELLEEKEQNNGSNDA